MNGLSKLRLMKWPKNGQMSRVLLLDTNIILRFFIASDVDGYQQAKKIISSVIEGKCQAKISILVISELVWTLSKFYRLAACDYVPMIIGLLANQNFSTLEIKKADVIDLLKAFEKKSLSWTDVYLAFIADTFGYKLETFDKKLQKNS